MELRPRQKNAIKLFKGKILDIGCGEGKVVIDATKKGLDITGCDVSFTELEKADELAKQEDIEINTVQGDVYHLPFERESFDTILMGQILEHLKEPRIGIINALELLKPGGTLIVTIPAGFAHMDNDHKNFFFLKTSLEFLNYHWVLEMLPYNFTKIYNILVVDDFFDSLDCESDIKEVTWESDNHPSYDYFITLKKQGETNEDAERNKGNIKDIKKT